MTPPPDPRTACDDDDATSTGTPADALNRGVSAKQPAEGADDKPGEQPGSPKG